MNVNGASGSPYMQSIQGMQNTRGMQGGTGVNAREIAENSMAVKQLPMQAAETAGRATTEAKGMFVDTYA